MFLTRVLEPAHCIVKGVCTRVIAFAIRGEYKDFQNPVVSTLFQGTDVYIKHEKDLCTDTHISHSRTQPSILKAFTKEIITLKSQWTESERLQMRLRSQKSIHTSVDA